MTQIHQQLWMVVVAVACQIVADGDWVHRAPYGDAEREDSVAAVLQATSPDAVTFASEVTSVEVEVTFGVIVAEMEPYTEDYHLIVFGFVASDRRDKAAVGELLDSGVGANRSLPERVDCVAFASQVADQSGDRFAVVAVHQLAFGVVEERLRRHA